MCGFHGDGAYLGLSAHARLSLIPTFRPVAAFHLGSCSFLLACMVSLVSLTFLKILVFPRMSYCVPLTHSHCILGTPGVPSLLLWLVAVLKHVLAALRSCHAII